MRVRRLLLVPLLGLVMLGCGGQSVLITSPRANGLLACLVQMRSVAVAPSGDAWIVGTGFSGGDLDLRAHCSDTLREQNGAWRQVAIPADTHLISVAAVSASDVWAGADNGGGFYHFDGTGWSHNAFAVPPGSFSGANRAVRAIAMTSSEEGWALLDNRTNNLVHYTGGAWQLAGTLDAPDLTNTYSALTSLSMLSPSDGWAVGGHYIAHYDGSAWKLVPSPVADRVEVDLAGVSMASADEGWAVGAVTNANDPARTSLSNVSGILLHYHQGAWSVAATPSAVFYAVAMTSPTDGWASASEGSDDRALMRYQNGAWSFSDGPMGTRIESLALRSADDGWAVSNDAIYRYTGGAWTTAYTRGPKEPGPA